MISFNLKCLDCEAEFEGWFENSNEYSKQRKKKLITCPSCDSHKVEKGLMAPNLSKKSNSKNNKRKKTLASNISKLKKMVEQNFDYVGDKFTEEAKKIKYGETKKRSIYGEATLDQTNELIEEDIDILPLPFSSKKTN
tara:strand:- start:1713 stop:2126 length:414 start_codon:yes stop_codon:yes gene_type:complete